ncbi:MAG TPA: hypothetical protein DD632_03775 [Oribacterium sp.]|nr:hypothetical protein [Oribacterium sp.]
MKLPNLSSINVSKTSVGVFLGLNETEIMKDAEFSEMKNISSDMYPGITCRKKRGDVLKKLSHPHGLFWKNGLLYIDGEELYYKDEKVGTVEDSDKKIVGMGAYVCIWPDKVVFNTNDRTLNQIEASWAQSAAATIAPVSAGSTYVKIQSTGIGKNFDRYDAVNLSGFTSYGDYLNVSKVIQEKDDDYIVVIATDGDGAALKNFTQNSGISAKRSCPDMDFICEFNNRLWGCSSKNHEIYASKLGDPLNWNSFEGISTDSYAVSIGSDGDFTGMIAHQGYVVAFKEDHIHTIYGTKPSNFTLDTIEARGPMKGCEKSLCHVNETVFYAARNAIVSFEGSTPEPVSDKLRIRYKEASGNQYDSKYFISLKDEKDTWHLYVYDTRRSSQYNSELWYEEDDLELRFSCYAEGKLYLIDQNGNLRTLYEDEEERLIDWNLVSGYLEEGSMNKKKVHRMQLNLELVPNASVELLVRYDNSPLWVRMASITADRRGSYQIPIRLKRAERYQYMLRGKGKFKLYGMTRIVEQGSER